MAHSPLIVRAPFAMSSHDRASVIHKVSPVHSRMAFAPGSPQFTRYYIYWWCGRRSAKPPRFFLKAPAGSRICRRCEEVEALWHEYNRQGLVQETEAPF